MEGYPYTSTHPDSGDSTPRFREPDSDHSVASWEEQPPSSAARAKLLCSYGGRIQPRQHDNQLAYVGGETKILAVERSIRFPAVIARLSSLSGADELVLKYQLPGEDLDALVSVTNDEDLEHMMMEYDRLHHGRSSSGSGKPAQRLRLFLFPPPVGGGKAYERTTCLSDAPPAVESVTVPIPTTETGAPDYLFGLDNGFVPPPAVKVREPALEYAAVTESAPARSEIESVISPAEIPRHVNEIQRLQIAENNHNLQVNHNNNNNNNNMKRNGSDETLARVYPGEYYVPRVQEQAPPVQTPAYWPDHNRSMAPPTGRFTSVAGGGDQQFFFIPASHGVFPPQAAPAGQGGYYTTMQRMVPASAFESSAAAPAYTMGASAQAAKAAYDSGVQVAYDSSGRAVYYQAVGASVAINPESKALKPSQVS